MSAVSGTRRAIKELVDGTIRVQVDIDPRFRKKFFELFPEIDSPVALAPLTPGFEGGIPEGAEWPGGDAPAKGRKPGQTLSQYAALLCQKPDFHRFLAAAHTEDWRQCLQWRGEDPVESAAEFIRRWCEIPTRAKLDDPAFTGAIADFHSLREEFHEWVGK